VTPSNVELILCFRITEKPVVLQNELLLNLKLGFIAIPRNRKIQLKTLEMTLDWLVETSNE